MRTGPKSFVCLMEPTLRLEMGKERASESLAGTSGRPLTSGPQSVGEKVPTEWSNIVTLCGSDLPVATRQIQCTGTKFSRQARRKMEQDMSRKMGASF